MGSPRAQLSHVGFYVHDLDRQASFYKTIFAMVETDRGISGNGDPIVFLTGDSAEHHQLVLTAGLPPEVARTWLNQLSFRVADLEGLREFYRWVRLNGVTITAAVSHGNAWSIYFPDPEGNNVEVYSVSPWYVSQPFRKLIDLDREVEEIMADTYASVEDASSLRAANDWSTDLETRLTAQAGPADDSAPR